MQKFVIERDVPGVGELTDAELREISMKSVAAIQQPGARHSVAAQLRDRRQSVLRLPRGGRVGGSRAREARGPSCESSFGSAAIARRFGYRIAFASLVRSLLILPFRVLPQDESFVHSCIERQSPTSEPCGGRGGIRPELRERVRSLPGCATVRLAGAARRCFAGELPRPPRGAATAPRWPDMAATQAKHSRRRAIPRLCSISRNIWMLSRKSECAVG